MKRPLLTIVFLLGLFRGSFALSPLVGLAYFPRTDPGQFVINVKAVTGTRLDVTEAEIKKLEDLVRHEVDPHDLRLIVSNIGINARLFLDLHQQFGLAYGVCAGGPER